MIWLFVFFCLLPLVAVLLRLRRALRRGRTVALILMGLGGAAGSAGWRAAAPADPAPIPMVVAADGLNVRACPALDCAALGRLPAGRTVAVAELSGLWGRIACPPADCDAGAGEGWVHTGYLAPP
ncbi:SH3 domain-containing protein [Wenxinia saemankumensis]|uniref:SH3 domain-containing protein n=1 Tax=Wenxinia saemankumensis TaxID=1447782 RepID=A0A1M6CFI2_9RHOB|nr:SH3 domain-containing protein [Wenxinia saemankumensis]SHI59746.1 SH3 domain-containing protein [Wenxinia saemankumensis]